METGNFVLVQDEDLQKIALALREAVIGNDEQSIGEAVEKIDETYRPRAVRILRDLDLIGVSINFLAMIARDLGLKVELAFTKVE